MSDLERLRRWEDSGGTWRVVRRRPDSVTIALCQCVGGEEADRLTSTDAAVLTHVGRRDSNEDAEPDLAH